MRSRGRLARVALTAVLGLALAACGGGNIQSAPAPSGGGGPRSWGGSGLSVTIPLTVLPQINRRS